jgi:DNA-binding MarR family transcriptional regulator
MPTTSQTLNAAQPVTGVMQQIRILRRELQHYSAAVEKRFGVTSAQVDFLLELHSTPMLRLSDLQNRIGIHQATASNMVAQLTKRRLIVKIPHPADKRSIVIRLTDEGVAFVESQDGLLVLRRQWEEHFRNMTPQKLAVIGETMGELMSVISRVSAFCESLDADDLCSTVPNSGLAGPTF